MNTVVDYFPKKVIALMVGLSFSFLIALDVEEKAKKEAEEKARLAAEEKQKEMEAQSQTEQGNAEKKTSGETKGQVNGARTNKAKNPKGDKPGEKQQNGEKGLPGKGSLGVTVMWQAESGDTLPLLAAPTAPCASMDAIRTPIYGHQFSSTSLAFPDALETLTRDANS